MCLCICYELHDLKIFLCFGLASIVLTLYLQSPKHNNYKFKRAPEKKNIIFGDVWNVLLRAPSIATGAEAFGSSDGKLLHEF